MSDLFEYLIAHGITVATAESCTGGNIAAEFVSHSGISKVFLLGAVTYANEAKMNVLGVKRATLASFGAVSSQCAHEMLKGLEKISGADACLCTTGIAGPSGGTDEKPVGLVFVGVRIFGKSYVSKCNFSGSRSEVIEQAKNRALKMLFNLVNKTEEN